MYSYAVEFNLFIAVAQQQHKVDLSIAFSQMSQKPNISGYTERFGS